jgi:hypothetical protein
MSLRLVRCVTATAKPVMQTSGMDTMFTGYKVERTLPDGQRVQVGTFRHVREATKVIKGLSEYWPGDYQIVRPDSQAPDAGQQPVCS